ncbi:MAG: BNR-4 repeat-containing protein [Planctomycetaceae bacterium]|nr:BNR-4 repeat-containing protein [Planctomycetaceae bacterium]
MRYVISFLIFVLFVSPLSATPPSGHGVSFDGQNGYIVSDFKLPAKTFSVAAWVCVTQNSGSQMIASLGKPGNDFSLYLYQGNVRMLVEHNPAAGSNPGNAYDFALAPLPKPNEWTHYLGTYNGETITIYLNGVKKGTKKAPCKRDVFHSRLFLGTAPESGRGLKGSLDNVRFWNRPLTSEEAEKIVNGENVSDGLIAEWNADKKSETEWLNAVEGAPKAVLFKPTAAEQSAQTKQTIELLNKKDNGYRGIWYHNQPSKDEYVFKYSGGLGTYPANHYPFAVYAPEAGKTFFCYGGTEQGTEKSLLHEVSYFDHQTGTVPHPTILLDKKTDDAHDNPVMSIDDQGYLWIFSTSHGTGRPSFIHKSRKPYDIEEFERISATKLLNSKTEPSQTESFETELFNTVPLNNFSYFQIYHLSGRGFAAMFTTYDKRILNDPSSISARTLCSMSSSDGVKWSEWRPYAGILYGHYQSTGVSKTGKIGSSFNFHPNDKQTGRVGLNYRSNLYYMETKDSGKTWQTVQGKPITVPLKEIENETLVHDYYNENRNVYIMDVNFDDEDKPVILYLTSKGYESGPKNDPRRWYTAYWTGKDWKINSITDSDNNYDFGSIYIEKNNLWRIIGTTEKGPQAYNTGGEIAVWLSRDWGTTWNKEKQLTTGSEFNQCYPRRPVNAHSDFYALWACGHGRKKSTSTLYFCNKNGDVFELPRQMDTEHQKPKQH